MKKLGDWDELLRLIGNGVFILALGSLVALFISAIIFFSWLVGLIIH